MNFIVEEKLVWQQQRDSNTKSGLQKSRWPLDGRKEKWKTLTHSFCSPGLVVLKKECLEVHFQGTPCSLSIQTGKIIRVAKMQFFSPQSFAYKSVICGLNKKDLEARDQRMKGLSVGLSTVQYRFPSELNSIVLAIHTVINECLHVKYFLLHYSLNVTFDVLPYFLLGISSWLSFGFSLQGVSCKTVMCWSNSVVLGTAAAAISSYYPQQYFLRKWDKSLR